MDQMSRNAIEMRLREIGSYFSWTQQNCEAWVELNLSILDGVAQGRAVISRFGWAPDAVISPSAVGRSHRTAMLIRQKRQPKVRPTRRERLHASRLKDV